MTGTDKDLLDRFTGILRDKTPPTELPDIFEGEAEQVHAALAVYRNNVRSSLSRVLADTFPVLFELVGEPFLNFWRMNIIRPIRRFRAWCSATEIICRAFLPDLSLRRLTLICLMSRGWRAYIWRPITPPMQI